MFGMFYKTVAYPGLFYFKKELLQVESEGARSAVRMRVCFVVVLIARGGS
jgi:hypothetical protein